MSRRLVGIILLLVLSLCLGMFTGERYFNLFLKSVPPMSQSVLSTSTIHGACLFYGFIVGMVLFGWAFLAATLSPFFRGTGAGPTGASHG